MHPASSAPTSLAGFLLTREKTLNESQHVAWIQFGTQA